MLLLCYIDFNILPSKIKKNSENRESALFKIRGIHIQDEKMLKYTIFTI